MILKLKEIAKIVSVPLTLVAIYFSMMVVWKIFDLPSDEKLIGIIQDFFVAHGLIVVFVGAFIEGFLLLGQYFPGGTIIFLGVISAGSDPVRAAVVVSTVSVAFVLAYTANYLIGKYGWYRLLIKFGLRKSLDKAQKKLLDQGLNAIIFSYWEPNLASLVATAAGILRVPFRRFEQFSIFGVFIWNLFWGTLVFLLGAEALKLIGIKYVAVIFAGWIAIMLVKHYIVKAKNNISKEHEIAGLDV